MDFFTAFLPSLNSAEAYALLLGLLVGSGFGLPVNEDILLLTAAALTRRGVMDPVPLMAAAWPGLITADSLVLHWGHRFGVHLLRHRSLAHWLPEARLASMPAVMRRHGPGFMFVARFIPGLRTRFSLPQAP